MHLFNFGDISYEPDKEINKLEPVRFRILPSGRVVLFQPTSPLPKITQVYLNAPYLTVLWEDKETTVVKCHENDTFDPEIGLAMAISKRYFKELGMSHPREAFKSVVSKARKQGKSKKE